MTDPEDLQILQEEVKRATGVHNFPAELLKQSGDETTKAITSLCQTIFLRSSFVKPSTTITHPFPSLDNSFATYISISF